MKKYINTFILIGLLSALVLVSCSEQTNEKETMPYSLQFTNSENKDDGDVKVYLGNGNNFEDITELIDDVGIICQPDKCSFFIKNPLDTLSGKAGILYILPIVDESEYSNLLINEVGGWDAVGKGSGILNLGEKAPVSQSMPIITSWRWMGGNIKRSGIVIYGYAFEASPMQSTQIDQFPNLSIMQGVEGREDVSKSWHYGWSIQGTVPVHNQIFYLQP